MWKHCCLFVCALMAFVAGTDLLLSAQDPASQPLVQFADLIYLGAFRLPRAPLNGDDLSFGGRPFAYNPARNSLFVGSKTGRITEVAIPGLVNTTNVNAMAFAAYLQGFADPLEGNIWQVATDGAAIDSLLVDGDQIVGTASIFYDANNVQRVSHYTRSTDLSRPSFSGMAPVWQQDRMGFISGYLATVPAEWQETLGGPAITGQCCTPIAWKTSWGPAAFAFNPSHVGSRASWPIPATPLLYYTNEHPTLGQWSATGNAYGATTRVNGVAIIAGTRTALFFGSTGTGSPCYGNGTSIPGLHGTASPDGTLWCYDPTSTDKGSHAYPYRYQIWAYDLNDFVAVKEGRKQPWDVLPYGVWPFELPVPELHVRLGGIAYDAARQVIYISQMYGDTDTFANRALVHALRIGSAPGAPPSRTPDPASERTTGVSLSANMTAPRPAGTTITWTAAPAGGVAPHQYKWQAYDGTSWTSGPWTTSSTFAWTPTVAAEFARVSIWVRSADSTADIYEASTEQYFAVTPAAAPPPPPPPAAPGAKATAVTISANKVQPQPVGTTITWTASASGGVAPYQYQWWMYDGTSWASTPWSTSNALAWTPARAHPYARVSVWVRSNGSAANIYEISTEQFFAIR